MRVSDIIRIKGNEVICLPPSATVQELLDLLAEKNIGAVIIQDGEAVAGIVSERDVVRGARTAYDPAAPVLDLMTRKVVTCEPADDVEELAQAMTARRIRHVPVIDEGELVAIVSIGDVVKARLSALQAERDQLRDYVTG